MGGPAIIDHKKYKEFDNFHPCLFYIDGVLWHSSEQYYQSRKCLDPQYQFVIRNCILAKKAYHAGQRCPLREDWEDIKVEVMFRANLAKISQHSELADLLISTGFSPIIFLRSTAFWNEKNAAILERIRNFLRWTHDTKCKP